MKLNFKTLALTLAVLSLSFADSFGQQYLTRDAYVRFFSSTPVEDIEAVSNQGSSVIDAESGEIVFQILMRGFTFEKALMQEHFNENYVESEKFPKASFAGKIDNLSEVDFSEDGTYTAKIKGDFTVHGVAQPREIEATITVKDGEVFLESIFMVSPEDHDIDIPSAVRDKIANEMEVTVKAKYQLR